MKDKEKQITINCGAGAMVDLLNNEIEELQKAKAIEEMAKIVDEMYNVYTTTADDIAEGLYNAGYRKLPEDSVVLSREEYNDLILAKKTFASDGEEVSSDTLLSTFKGIKEQARKETAEKIYTKIKDSFLMNSNNRYALKLWIEEQFGLEIKE